MSKSNFTCTFCTHDSIHIHVAVEDVVGKVKGLLATSQEWEQKAKAALKQK